MRVWIAAGGSGGHLYPALAVVEELEAAMEGTRSLFAVSRRGLEERVLDAQHRPYRTLWTEGFHRGEVVRNLLFPLRLAAGFFQSVWAVLRLRPNVAFGTGGFVSGPALLAARMLGVPVALVALDARPGLTIRMLSPLARKTYVTGHAAMEVLGERSGLEIVGTPMRRPDPVPRERARDTLGLPPDARVLLVTGGSQGSAALNRAVAGALKDLFQVPDLTLLWQTGEEGEAMAEGKREELGGEYRERVLVLPYIDAMEQAWSAADLAVCRAGASTIAELTAYGVPSILVPLPTSAGGHQQANARAMEDTGAAVVLPESDLTPGYLARRVRALLDARNGLESMRAQAASLGHTGAARTIARGLVEIARGVDEESREAALMRLEGGGA
ncbi:MAG: UDP-N-acetylglucosamine--N-acetylmuramyl-(pentapeptide) pyrophosphoryl-undecaprenol N-acetylglucosamine transferase [bacterium]